jgi:hypothetical protein
MKNCPLGKHGIHCPEIGGNWGEQTDNHSIVDLNRALDFLEKIRRHNWRRAFWYGGK